MRFLDRLLGIKFNQNQVLFNKEQIKLNKLFHKKLEELEKQLSLSRHSNNEEVKK